MADSVRKLDALSLHPVQTPVQISERLLGDESLTSMSSLVVAVNIYYAPVACPAAPASPEGTKKKKRKRKALLAKHRYFPSCRSPESWVPNSVVTLTSLSSVSSLK